MRRKIANALDDACAVVDRLPSWTWPIIGRWLGCPNGLAYWGHKLEERWGLEAPPPMTAAEIDALAD